MIKNISTKCNSNVVDYHLYAFLCVIIFCVIYLPIYFSDKVFMYLDIGADTYCSYWPSISYARDLLRNPRIWDFNLGLGGTTSVYLSGFVLDPFNWFLFFFPDNIIPHLFILQVFFKYIIVAIYSIKYTLIKGLNKEAAIISSLLIVYSGWFVGWGQHYPYATAYVFFIVTLYAFELWIQQKKVLLLYFSIAYYVMYSAYYGYMTLCFLGIYYLYHLFIRFRLGDTPRLLLINTIHSLFLVIISIGTAAWIFFPVLEDLSYSPRVSGNTMPSLRLASLIEYASLIMRMFSNTILGVNTDEFIGYGNYYESPFMYVGIISMFCILSILLNKDSRKKYGPIILILTASIIFLNLSSPIFNGFSTKAYRWTFIFVPVIAILAGKAMGVLLNCKKKIYMIIMATGVLPVSIFYSTINTSVNKIASISCIVVITILLLYALILSTIRNHKLQRKILLAMVCVELIINGCLSVQRPGLIDYERVQSAPYFDKSIQSVASIKQLENDSFYRISKDYSVIDLTDSQMQHYNGEKMYSSVVPENIWRLMDFFDLRYKKSNQFLGFDDKQALRDISGSKYMISKNNNNHYGYEAITQDGCVMKNHNAVTNPGILYNHYIDIDDLIDYKAFDRQYMVYSALLVDGSSPEIVLNGTKMYADDIERHLNPRSLVYHKESLHSGNYLFPLSPNRDQTILICYKSTHTRGEIQLLSKGVPVENEVIQSVKDNEEREYYIDLMNVDEISVAINEGILDSIDIYAIDANDITEKSKKLNEGVSTISSSNHHCTMLVESDIDAMLLITIPYHHSWKAFIDGNETTIFPADIAYMAINVPAGKSSIELYYSNQTHVIGFVVSLVSICVFLPFCLFLNRYDKNRHDKHRHAGS